MPTGTDDVRRLAAGDQRGEGVSGDLVFDDDVLQLDVLMRGVGFDDRVLSLNMLRLPAVFQANEPGDDHRFGPAP